MILFEEDTICKDFVSVETFEDILTARYMFRNLIVSQTRNH
jgi:hypothetical protein